MQRIVKISGGAPTLGPNGTTPTAVAHWRSEQRIERSGLDFAFLRPSFFMQNLLETVAPAVAASGALAAPFGHAPIAMVDARDIADCAIAALLDDRPGQRAWQLTGPRPVTLRRDRRDPRRPLRRRAGEARRAHHAPPRPAGRRASTTPIRMAAYFASGADGTVTDHVLRLTGHAPRSIEAFLDEHRGAFSPTTPPRPRTVHARRAA